MKRYALVKGARDRREAEAYLPDNYSVLVEETTDPPTFLIAGEDRQGWTLDSYVIPRYASGLIRCEEIDPPEVELVPA